jgi:type I restriction enzyme S subunit
MFDRTLLPKDWTLAKLADYLQERRARNRKNARLPVYTVSNAAGFVLSDEFFDKRVYSRNLATYKLVSPGDFAYNPYRVNVGSLGLLNDGEGGLVSPAYVVFCIRESERLDAAFLFLLLKSGRYISEIMRLSMSRGSVRRSLAFRDLCEPQVPLPTIDEQRRIARALSTIQRAIEAQDKVIAAARELKRSLMKHLFTYGPAAIAETARVPLKETEIGPVPEHWEPLTFGSLIAEGPQNGLYKPQSLYGMGTPIVRINDFDNEGGILTSIGNRVRLADEDVKTFRLNCNDILINRVNSLSHLGKAALVGELREPTVFESNMMRFAVDTRRVLPEYAFRFLCTPPVREHFRGKSKRAVAQSSINQQDVKSLPFPLPPIREQAKVVTALATVERKIDAEGKRKAALQALFKTMLHHLMTGKIRVKDL